MTPEFWSTLIEKGATVALAVFAIWILQREFNRQLKERDSKRESLQAVIDRNTKAWVEATNTMTSIAAGIAILTESMAQERDNLGRIRVLLARRPCIADEIAEDGDVS